jgi:hypothetical protein
MTNDELIERLGQAQQKVMTLTVTNRRLKKQLENIEYRADALEALVMDVLDDMDEGKQPYEVEYRINRVMQRLAGEDQ